MSGGADPIRVLMVGPSLHILGGQSVQADRLLRALSGRSDLRLQFLPVNPRLPGLRGRMQRVKYLRTIVTEGAYLFRLLRAIPEADVIHVYSASYLSFLLAPVPAIFLARLMGRKVILNYHSGEAQDHLTRWGWHAIPLMRLAHRIVVQSEYLQQVFARHGLRAEVIPNSLDPAAFHYRERTTLRPRFLTNRNHERHYGVDTVLRAFGRIQQEVPDATLVVAGSGSLTAALRALAQELSLHGVEFTGPVPPDEMPRLYEAADVLLNGSTIDSMPLSILESFASGLPVVSTDAGGIATLVQQERTGLLVPPEDPEALARAALRLLREPGLASRVAAQAREECLRRFSDETVSASWQACYRSVSRAA